MPLPRHWNSFAARPLHWFLPPWTDHSESHTNYKAGAADQWPPPNPYNGLFWHRTRSDWCCKNLFPRVWNPNPHGKNYALDQNPTSLRPCWTPCWYRNPPKHCYSCPARPMHTNCTRWAVVFFQLPKPCPLPG